MKVSPFLGDALLLEPEVFGDARGFFFESFNRRSLQQAIARDVSFVQDNHARSSKNVLRGVHYQIRRPQAKVVRVLAGEVFDVGVDLRRSSATFGRWAGAILSSQNRKQLWLPEGFAHAYLVLSDYAEILVKTSDYWAPDYERSIAWNDPTLAIPWPIDKEPLLSTRDRQGVSFEAAELFP